MITVRVKTFASLRELLSSSFDIRLEDNATIHSLAEEIFKKYGGYIKDRMIDPETGAFFSYFKILKNGRNIEFLQGMKTRLDNGDEITIFPPVAGG